MLSDLNNEYEVLLSSMTPLYKIYTIFQNNNKKRIIEEPCEELKKLQRKLLPYLENIELHPSCIATKTKGTVVNSLVHHNAKSLLKVDLKNCYRSIRPTMFIREVTSESNLRTIIDICFYIGPSVEEHYLPTGAPTSPVICNISLTYLDNVLANNAKSNGYRYTRYIDDLIFSTEEESKADNKFKEFVFDTIHNQELEVNYKKSRWHLAATGDPLIATGIRLVGDNRIPKSFNRMMRARLQNIAMAGVGLDAETHGCLSYIRSIDPNQYTKFLKYYEKRKAIAINALPY